MAQELGPALEKLAGRFEELRAKGMSDSDIAALAEFDNALNDLSNSMQVMAAGPIVKMINGLREMLDILTTTGGGLTQGFAKLFEAIGSRHSFLETVFTGLKVLIAHVNAGLLQIYKNLLLIGRAPFAIAQLIDPNAFKALPTR